MALWREPKDIISVTTRLPLDIIETEKYIPPIWATPGRHILWTFLVRSAPSLPGLHSPYFRQSGAGFLDALKTLHTYFVKTQGREGEKQKQNIENFCLEEHARQDSSEHRLVDVVYNARERCKGSAEAGGSYGIAISVLDSRPPKARHPRRPAEEQNDGNVPKKKSVVTKITDG